LAANTCCWILLAMGLLSFLQKSWVMTVVH
jgi:hypothetical protein